MISPTFIREAQLFSQGYRRIAGVDEVGAGPLAGPVVAGAVILPIDFKAPTFRDSKKLSKKQKEAHFDWIVNNALEYAIGVADSNEINQIGIRAANLLAMRRAALGLKQMDFMLVDAWKIPDIKLPQQGIIRGDATIQSIAAASILAKVTRDKMMEAYALEFPQYHFEKNMGYGTKVHMDAIRDHGACVIHRTSWSCFSK